MLGMRNLSCLLKRKAFFTDRAVAAESARAECARLSELDQGLSPAFHDGDAFTTGQCRLNHQCQESNHEGEQYGDGYMFLFDVVNVL